MTNLKVFLEIFLFFLGQLHVMRMLKHNFFHITHVDTPNLQSFNSHYTLDYKIARSNRFTGTNKVNFKIVLQCVTNARFLKRCSCICYGVNPTVTMQKNSRSQISNYILITSRGSIKKKGDEICCSIHHIGFQLD